MDLNRLLKDLNASILVINGCRLIQCIACSCHCQWLLTFRVKFVYKRNFKGMNRYQVQTKISLFGLNLWMLDLVVRSRSQLVNITNSFRISCYYESVKQVGVGDNFELSKKALISPKLVFSLFIIKSFLFLISIQLINQLITLNVNHTHTQFNTLSTCLISYN